MREGPWTLSHSPGKTWILCEVGVAALGLLQSGIGKKNDNKLALGMSSSTRVTIGRESFMLS